MFIVQGQEEGSTNMDDFVGQLDNDQSLPMQSCNVIQFCFLSVLCNPSQSKDTLF